MSRTCVVRYSARTRRVRVDVVRQRILNSLTD